MFVEPLKNRTPVTKPSLSDRNFTPNSTAPVSPDAAVPGVAPADQIVNGPDPTPAAVVNDQVVGAAIAFPAVSNAPDTVAV